MTPEMKIAITDLIRAVTKIINTTTEILRRDEHLDDGEGDKPPPRRAPRRERFG